MNLRGLAWLLALLATIGTTQVAAQQVPLSIEERVLPFVRELNHKTLPDGRRFNLYCTGQGTPTVLLNSHYGLAAGDWLYIQPELSRFTRVCSWDKPGHGVSHGTAFDQTVETTTFDLQTALNASGEHGPYLVVGYGAGAYNALRFADLHTLNTSGMVLIAPRLMSQLEIYSRIAPTSWLARPSTSDSTAAFFRRCARQLAAGEIAPGDGSSCWHFYAGPVSLLTPYLNLITSDWVTQFNSAADSIESMDADGELIINPQRDYGDMPLMVLMPNQPESNIPENEAERRDYLALKQASELEYERYARFSSRGLLVRSAYPAMTLQYNQPEIVIAVIRSVIDLSEGRRRPPY